MVMSNSFFRFKKFMVLQDKCAMKVTTDACIQGAWTPLMNGAGNVLDIGAGTGLLSLMLAQRNDSLEIDAVEIDAPAAAQAKANVAASPWETRITVVEGDVRDLQPDRQYDLIITNPPFFSNSLLGDKQDKNIARHTLSLSFDDLYSIVCRKLKSDGYVSVLLPMDEYKRWAVIMLSGGWKEIAQLQIKHSADAPVKRVVGLFSRAGDEAAETTLIIKNGDNYTADFCKLLSPFYLNL